MANAIYPKAKEQLLKAGINMNSGNIKAFLIDLNDYTYSASHEFVSDLAGIIGRSGNLASKTFANGLFDSADPTVASVSGDPFEGLVLVLDTGSDATSRLIAYFDTGGTLTGTPDGGNWSITVNASGWFQL